MVGAAIGAVTSLINTGIGVAQGIKANKLQKKLVRPTQSVQGEYLKNSADADEMARVGMSQQQYNNSLNNVQRNTNAGLRQVGRMGNSGSIASIVRAQNDATMGLDAQDANMRQRNMLNAQNQRSVLGGQKQAAWDWNSRDNYGEQLARIQALRGASTQNIGNGINSAANLGMAMSYGQDLTLKGGGDTTMGGNFTKNPLMAKLYGVNRQQFIGQGAQFAGIKQPPLLGSRTPYTGQGAQFAGVKQRLGSFGSKI